jgi:hypothetical protein
VFIQTNQLDLVALESSSKTCHVRPQLRIELRLPWLLSL